MPLPLRRPLPQHPSPDGVAEIEALLVFPHLPVFLAELLVDAEFFAMEGLYHGELGDPVSVDIADRDVAYRLVQDKVRPPLAPVLHSPPSTRALDTA